MPPSTHHRFHGRPVRIDWDTADRRAAGAPVLSHYGLDDGPPGAQDDAGWRIAVTADRRPVPAGLELVARHRTGLVVGRDGPDYVLVAGDDTARVQPGRGRAEFALPTPPAAAGALDPALYLFTTFTLLLFLQHEEHYGLHAAALTPEGDDGVLVIAESDSGKSTLTMHLVRQGWRFLTDDSALVHLGADGRVAARALRRDFALDPDAADLFPEIAEASAPMFTGYDKWRVDVDRLYPGQRCARLTPRLLVFPSLTDAPASRLTPLSPSAALMRLLRQTSLLTPAPDQAARHLAVLKRLVEQAPAVALAAAADIHHDGARAARLLGAALRGRSTPSG